MGPDLIIALATCAGLAAGAVATYVRMRVDIRELQVRVESMDHELARLVRDLRRFENLILELNGRAPRLELDGEE